MSRRKGGRQKWISSACPFSSSFHHYQLPLLLEWSGSQLGLANGSHRPNFRGWKGTKVWLFLWLPHAHQLIDNDCFCSGGHTPCLEALSCSYCGNRSISSLHLLFPFTFRPRMVKDLTVSSTVVPLYPYQFPLIQLRLWKRVPLLKCLQLPHFLVPSASCQDLARYNF